MQRNGRQILSLLLLLMISTAALTELSRSVRRVYARMRQKNPGPAWVDHPDALHVQQPTVQTRQQMFNENHTVDVVAIRQVWAAYAFYNDSINGPGMASLFTPDGVDQHIWDDEHGKFIPDYGVVAPADVGKNMTDDGPKGSGCILHGREQIAYYFGKKRAPESIAWPGHNHHEAFGMMVKVSDDGQTAVVSSPHIDVGQNAQGAFHFTTGGHRAFMKKTSEGWEIAELYAIDDHPLITPGCDVDGPTGMREHHGD